MTRRSPSFEGIRENPIARMTGVRITLALTVLILGGCSTPLNEVRSFGKASSSFATDAAKGYTLLSDSLSQYEVSKLAADSAAQVDKEFFEGEKDVQSLRKSTARLSAVLTNVAEYGDALQKFAEADFKKDIDESSTKLYESLTGLQSTYENLSGSKLNLSGNEIRSLSAAVEGIGVITAETKRKAAIRKIVTNTNPAIQQVSKTLTARFSGNIGPDIEAKLDTVKAHMGKDFNTNWKDKSYSQRRERLEVIRKQQAFNETIRPLFDELSKAARKMGESHQALYEAVQANTFTTAQLQQDVSALIEYARSVKKFYDGLEKNSDKKSGA